jgi:uncharacterized protein (TIGR00369 family)
MSDKPIRYGVVSTDELLSYDGLAFLRDMIAGVVPQPPIAKTLGFRLDEADPGRAVFEGARRRAHAHYNPLGTVHGGFTATLLDSALACAIFTTLKQGDAWTTLELKLNFVRPMFEDTGLVRAEGRVTHPGRRAATAEGMLKDVSGKLYAHATTTCMVMPKS